MWVGAPLAPDPPEPLPWHVCFLKLWQVCTCQGFDYNRRCRRNSGSAESWRFLTAVVMILGLAWLRIFAREFLPVWVMRVSLLGGQSRANHRGVIKLGQQI